MAPHGQQPPMTLEVKARVEGQILTADTSFAIPYVAWGLKNPSALFLRVNDQVNIHIHAVGQLKSSMSARNRCGPLYTRVSSFSSS